MQTEMDFTLGGLTQKDTILEHLKKHKTISSWESITKYHITRLSAHIYALKHEGYDIETEWKQGNGKVWGLYTLKS